jgi:hypothetical protein
MNAQQFLDRMAATANVHDLDAHMNLISKRCQYFRYRVSPDGQYYLSKSGFAGS